MFSKTRYFVFFSIFCFSKSSFVYSMPYSSIFGSRRINSMLFGCNLAGEKKKRKEKRATVPFPFCQTFYKSTVRPKWSTVRGKKTKWTPSCQLLNTSIYVPMSSVFGVQAIVCFQPNENVRPKLVP